MITQGFPPGMLAQGSAISGYDPLGMTFDGASGFYYKNYTPSGNKGTGVARFNVASVAADQYIMLAYSYTGATYRSNFQLNIFSNAHATATRRRKLALTVVNSAGSVVCRAFTSANMDDSTEHTVFAAYDGDAGTVQLYVDGVDALDAGNPENTLTTGTLQTGNSSSYFDVGALYGGASGAAFLSGELAYCGFREAYLTNPTDFYHPSNGLQELDTSGWTEWGAQPLLWADNAKFDTNNSGSLGAMTKSGTITGPA